MSTSVSLNCVLVSAPGIPRPVMSAFTMFSFENAMAALAAISASAIVPSCILADVMVLSSIPAAATPVNCEPSPTNEAAVTEPVVTTF